jgi:hypothetical protein
LEPCDNDMLPSDVCQVSVDPQHRLPLIHADVYAYLMLQISYPHSEGQIGLDGTILHDRVPRHNSTGVC